MCEVKTIDEITAELAGFVSGRRVCVLMSGGVDSSVAALLALRSGASVTGVVMRNTEELSHVAAARAVCAELGIECLSFDLRDEFSRLVIEPFEAEYSQGSTPNPCVACNRAVKFGVLWDEAEKYMGGRDFHVITGHYAITAELGNETALLRGVDRKKDQSYFLCMLPIDRVRRLLLPLGKLTKTQTKAIAIDLGAEALTKAAGKPESMENCFLGDRDYRDAVGGRGEGLIVDLRGNVIGRHSGVENFTIGQRRGLGLSARSPLFVVGIREEDNIVIAAERGDAMTRQVPAADINVLAPYSFFDGARLSGRIRSQAEPSPCRIEITKDGLVAVFDEPQFAPAPGQYLALYDGERLAAGARITEFSGA